MLKKHWLRFFLLLNFICGLQNFSRAHSYHFRSYSVDDGMPFVQVFTIYQDSRGNLWMGAYGGLSRFNGLSFQNYSPLNGLPNHWVNAITEYGDNTLWIGTIEGLATLKHEVFTTYTTNDGLPSNFISCLLRDERNNLFVGTDKGLAQYNNGKFVKLQIDPNFPDLAVLCFYEEPNAGKIWIGTTEGVYEFTNGKFTQQHFPNFYENDIRAINKDRNGRIVCGTQDGMFILENQVFRQFIPPDGTEVPMINAMVTDISGVLWIGAQNGLYSFDGSKFEYTKLSDDVNAEKIISVYNDYENNVWLGTASGLFRFRGKGFVSYGTHDGLLGNFIFGITEDQSGNLWVCSDEKGVFRYDGKTFTGYTKKDGMPADKTNAVYTLENGNVLVGTSDGLVHIVNNKVAKVYTTKDGLHNDSVNVIYRDTHGTLWLGGNNGITHVSSDWKFTPYRIDVPPNAPKPDVWCMLEDSKGNFWVGTYLGGLYTFSNGTFTRKDTELKFSGNSYFGISEDSHGNLFYASLDGVFIKTKNGIDSIREQHGLNSDLVYTMGVDRKKENLWIGTNQGINRFDLTAYANAGTKNVYTFGKEEGFTGVECNTNGIYEEDDGTMWFGTVNGLIKYNPKEYRSNPYYTKTSITSIALGFTDTILPANVILNYDENSVSFEYIGICFSNPSKVQYRYMLEGFETEFCPPTKERIARYPNIPSGTYTFKVISCNNEGLWNNDPASFTFTIATPIWKKTWFLVCVSLLVTALLLLAIFTRIRQIKDRERKESETRVALAGNELKALRAQMNPHFMFNSLNSIQHFILTNKANDAGKYLNKFARLMRMILNNSDKSQITIREEVEYLQLYIELEAMRFDNKFDWTIDIADNIEIDYIEIPAMLLQPYIENAILHGLTPLKSPGHLELSMRMQGNNLLCRIKDNGIGREKAREMRQLSNRKDHRSLGMKITSDRLELINNLHGSQLSMTITDLKHEDGNAAGTQVDIFIPVS
jgi:ligand-binding sensor domain-containing protein